MNKKLFKKLIYILSIVATVMLAVANILFYSSETREPALFLRIIAILAFPLFVKFTFYMIMGPWYKVAGLLRREKFADKQYFPRVSVLIPAWNEEVGILHSLKSAYNSDYGNLEIIVINDGSTDNTDKLVKEFIHKHRHETNRPEVIYYYQENTGKAGALNRGISLSSGEIVITVDADSFVKRNAVSCFVEHFKDPEVMCLAGNIVVGNKKSLLGTIQALEFLVTFYMKRCDSLMNGVYIVGGAAAAYRREVFRETGPFNTDSITEDIDMSMKILDLGYKIRYASDAEVVTEGAATMESLMAQRLRWKRGRFDTFFRFRKMFLSTSSVHNKFVTLLILPFALLSEIQLFFELFFLAGVYVYSFAIRDFSILFMSVLISGSIFLVLSLFRTRKPDLRLLPFALMGWALFYPATFVEYSALIRTLWSLFKKRSIKWQTWQRQGLLEDE